MKRALTRAVGVTPIWELTRVLRDPGCTVLTFHRIGRSREGFKHIAVDAFRQQMLWLRSHCTVVHPADFRTACAGPARARPAVLLTFDDGYRDYHDVAYPILEELQLPAVNFVASAFVDDPERAFWWDEVDRAVWASTRPHLDAFWRAGARIALDRAGREQIRLDVRRYVWSQPHHTRDATVGRLCDALGVTRRDLRGDRQVMTWDEIRAVSRLTAIGAHTHTHPLVTRVEEPELRGEVATSRDRIAAEVGRPTAFAYPSGAVSATAKRVVQEEGFALAFAGTCGTNGGDADWFALHRVNAPAEAGRLAYVLAGFAARRRWSH